MWMLERWPRIREKLGVETLRIVGEGSLYGQVESMIAAGQLPNVVLVGPLQRAETSREMGKAAYLLVPSLWEEPFGAVALEGVAAGAITILTDRGGLPETAGDLGLYFNPDDDASFDKALDGAHACFQAHLASPDARAAYDQRVADHIALFQPATVVGKILEEMAT
jgi:glycogen(starch) synthase